MFRQNVTRGLFVLCLSLVLYLSSSNVVAETSSDNSALVEITNGTATVANKQLTLRFSLNGCDRHVTGQKHKTELVTNSDATSRLDKTKTKCDTGEQNHVDHKPLTRGRPAAAPRRVGRAAWNNEPVDYMYNDDRQFKKLLHLLSGESKVNHENDVDMLRAVTKLSSRGLTQDESHGGSSSSSISSSRLVKRQPLDRLDEPSRWRTILKPKLGRAMLKRQPLDRLDEPSEWRNRMVPKLIGLAHKRYPIDRRDDRWRPSEWFSTITKRQPLDRLDEPSDWRTRLSAKLNRFGKRLAILNGDDDDDEILNDDESRD